MPIDIAEEFSTFKKTGKQTRLFYGKRIYDIFLIGCVAVFIFPVLSSADSYLHNEGLLPFPYPSFILLFSLFIPVLLKDLAKNNGQELLNIYQKTARVFVPFGIVALISLIWGLHPNSVWDNNGKLIFFYPYHFALLVFCIGITTSQVMRKYHRLIILISLIGTCISVGVDVVHPKTFSDLEARAAGFIGNANEGALTVLYLTICAINWRKNSFLNLLALSIAGMAIFATLSVGTLYLFAIVVFLYIAWVMKSSSIKKNIAFVILFSSLIVFVLIPLGANLISGSKMFTFHDAKVRLQKITSMGQGDLAFAKDHDRVKLIKFYLDIIQEAPFMGHGTGFMPIGETETHNIYLRVWVENGIPGLLAYLALIYFAFFHFKDLKDTRGMIFIFIICGAGFFDHNLLNNRSFVGLLGIVGALAYLDHSKAPQRILQKVKLTR